MTGWMQLNANMHEYYYVLKRNEDLKHAILVIIDLYQLLKICKSLT